MPSAASGLKKATLPSKQWSCGTLQEGLRTIDLQDCKAEIPSMGADAVAEQLKELCVRGCCLVDWSLLSLCELYVLMYLAGS